ncbi:MAG: histidinol-phosphate transaminase [Chloroflexi bacterium RBG_16_56_11]|nr:MAG: histidinol-phosphate transaminase [Chloroflexi bacterium RBG_16_56_11]
MTGSDGIEKYILPNLLKFTGYTASTSPDTLAGRVDVPLANIIKMNANENPYGCSPRVSRALAAYPSFHIYPDDGQQELRRLLAGYTGVDAARIVAGHGSNTLIDFIARLFVGPGDEVITCVPTFDLYRFSTELCRGTVVNVTRDDSFAVDVARVKDAVTARTKVIFLATPNNPTGNIVPRADIVEIIDTGVPVVVDEAYYEFSGETVMPLVDKYPNLMVLRSFSKWAGLAGLRVGYGVFPPRVAGYLMSIKIPHNVSVAAEVAVRESLADIDYLQSNVKAVIKERTRLFEALKSVSWLRPYPSRANFIYCALLKGSARELLLRLERRGILVRHFDKPLLKNSLRISVGKPEHTEALVAALRALEP